MAAISLSGRDFLQIRDAARLLGVTEKTLRNWDRAGHLPARRHPVNGYRIYHVGDLHAFLDRFNDDVAEREAVDQSILGVSVDDALPGNLPFDAEPELETPVVDELPPCHWSPEVALDPKHRPQRWDRPSSTVRRDWRKFPQEAHVLDISESKYRRLTVAEIALIQGFSPSVVEYDDLTERQRIAVLGDAVPPPLAAAVVKGLATVWKPGTATALEICAGIGGLAEGAAGIGLEHLRLVDASPICAALLRQRRPWGADRVECGDVRALDFSRFRGDVGLLSGGPPCQPWSLSGLHLGEADTRDLLGYTPELLNALQPEAFVFENVPGLAMFDDGTYLSALVRRLRQPGDDLSYGVMSGILNAADYGVPQQRKRIFIIGIRNRPSADAYRAFDAALVLASHRQQPSASWGSKSWVTVGDVLSTRQDPGGWRRWIGGRIV